MNNPKIIAVIPVYGRTSLLPFTIKRLLEKNKLFKVICCGNKEEDKKVCLESGAEWVQIKNNPLGNKWNKGFEYAEQFDPDGILFVGSSDWISQNWIPDAWKFLENDEYQMVGKKTFLMVDINILTNKSYYCKWNGYLNKRRANEPIGIGRLISRKFLQAIKYKPFLSSANKSMDYFMYQNCIRRKFKVKLIDDEEDKYMFLSLSTNAWMNKHKFFRHYSSCIIRKNRQIIPLVYNNFLNHITTALNNNMAVYQIYTSLLVHLGSILGARNTQLTVGHHSYLSTSLISKEKISLIEKEFPEINNFSDSFKKPNVLNFYKTNITLDGASVTTKNRIEQQQAYENWFYSVNSRIINTAATGSSTSFLRVSANPVNRKMIHSYWQNILNRTTPKVNIGAGNFILDEIILDLDKTFSESESITNYTIDNITSKIIRKYDLINLANKRIYNS